MPIWSKNPWIGWGLRVAGILLLVSVYADGQRLRALVRSHPDHVVSIGEILLAVVAFVSASAGSALATFGQHLFDHVEISAQWVRRGH